MNRFADKLQQHGLRLDRVPLTTLQINIGRKCNQTCTHCHVDAGPHRTEMMDEETARKIGAWIIRHRPSVVDITGGAPELSEHFRYFVETARSVDAHVIDRNNLTIIKMWTRSAATASLRLARTALLSKAAAGRFRDTPNTGDDGSPRAGSAEDRHHRH